MKKQKKMVPTPEALGEFARAVRLRTAEIVRESTARAAAYAAECAVLARAYTTVAS